MAYLTIHRLPGNAEELAERKRSEFDPVIRPLARKHGAILSATAPTGDGLLIVNLWQSPGGAAALQAEPDAVQARDAAELPAPDRFERYDDVEIDDFR
jgi:hypothetical protein